MTPSTILQVAVVAFSYNLPVSSLPVRDSLYFAVVTCLSVGYGDVYPSFTVVNRWDALPPEKGELRGFGKILEKHPSFLLFNCGFALFSCALVMVCITILFRFIEQRRKDVIDLTKLELLRVSRFASEPA